MMWFGEEAEALLKQLEKLFKRIVVRIIDFQNDWDRCDPIWRFCWQNRRGRWYETQISHYNGSGIDVYLYDHENIRKALLAEDNLAIVEQGGDTRYAGHNGAFESIWLSEIGSRYATLKEFVRWNPLPVLRPREHKYNPIIKERL